MMHVENPDPNWAERFRRKYARLLNHLNIAPHHVYPILSVCLGYRVWSERKGWGARVSLGDSETGSLYYNGLFFFRIALPFLVCFQIRWSGNPAHRRQYLQTHLGWRLNGQFGVAFRVQCDDSAAAGTTGPNFGQAPGWMEGTK